MTPAWLSCGDLEAPSDSNRGIATTEQAGVYLGLWDEVVRFRRGVVRNRNEVVSYMGNSTGSFFGNVTGERCSAQLVGVNTVWTADHCGREQGRSTWRNPGSRYFIRFGRFTIDFRPESTEDWSTLRDFEQGHGANMYLVQRLRELGLSPYFGYREPPVGQAPTILVGGDDLDRYSRFAFDYSDQQTRGLAILENMETSDFDLLRSFNNCRHDATDNRDGTRDLVRLRCDPVYLLGLNKEPIPVYPGEIWGWVEAAAEESRHGDPLAGLSVNTRAERRRLTGAFDTCGSSCPNDSILLSPGGTRRDRVTLIGRICGGNEGWPFRVCTRTDLDVLKGSSGGAVIETDDFFQLGVFSLQSSDCAVPRDCRGQGANKFAEASRAFAGHARANVSAIPKPDTDPPVSSRGEEYWANTSISNLVGETSPEHTQIQLRCGYRGTYVNGITGHLGTLKDFITYGVGGIAIHCRPDTHSTRDLLRLETHSMHAAGSSDFMWNMQEELRVSTEDVDFLNFRYQAYRNLIYGNGPALPYEDLYRRGQERLCGPGFALHGFGSSARDEDILHDIVDLECRRISSAWVIEPQGFDLAPQNPGLVPNNTASCGGEWMVGMVVHRHPETHAVSGLEPICGGFDTQGITL